MKWVVAAALLVGCGETGSTPDASPEVVDAIELPGCELGDTAFIARTVALRPDGEGHDLDGDGDIDNAAAPLAPFVNAAGTDRIEEGLLNLLWILRDLQLPPAPTPTEVLIYNTFGIDADVPIDPTNNHDNGEFLVTLADLDADCTPRAPGRVVQDGTHLAGTEDYGTLLTVSGVAETFHIVLEADVEADGSAMQARNSGVLAACGADRLPAPGIESGTVLGFAVVLGIQPDFDLDGDGLETIQVQDGAVVRCIDGPGTVIEGVGCACDPAIADGFSFSFAYEFVPARLVGVVTP